MNFLETIVKDRPKLGFAIAALGFSIVAFLAGWGTLAYFNSEFINYDSHETYEETLSANSSSIEEIKKESQNRTALIRAGVIVSRDYLAQHLNHLEQLRIEAIREYGLDSAEVASISTQIGQITLAFEDARSLLNEI